MKYLIIGFFLAMTVCSVLAIATYKPPPKHVYCQGVGVKQLIVRSWNATDVVQCKDNTFERFPY